MIVLFSFSRFFLMFVLLSTCILFPASVSATPVSLHFQDAEIADALQAVARFGGYGIVIDGETTGRVTIDAEAEPADFLPRLAKMYGLTATLKGGTFFVTSAAHARDVREAYVFPVHYSAPEDLLPALNLTLKKEGNRDGMANNYTDMKANADGRRTSQANRAGSGDDDADRKTRVKEDFSYDDDDVRVTLGTDGQSVVLYGTPAEYAMCERLVEELDVPAQQVALEAKVVSLTNEASRELGISWDWSGLPQSPATSDTYESHRRTYIGADGKATTVYEDVPKTEITRTYEGHDHIPGIVQFGRGPEGHPFEWYYEAHLHALETAGKAKLLSRPNVTTLSGREAVIEIGSEVPVPEVETTARSTTTSFTYHKAGIILRYTPYVSADGHITAVVHTEVSSPAYVADLKAYRFQKRSADTSVRLKDGETMVIGGLIGSEEARSVRKIPLLGDIPIIGQFFRDSQKSKQSSEIMIFLTAHVLPSDQQ